MASVSVEARKIGAVVGSLIGDAAAQPVHWVYDQDKLDKALANKEDVAFHDPPLNPFYLIDIGKNSAYGDNALTLLESLHSSKGFDAENFKQRAYDTFGPKSAYDVVIEDKYEHNQKTKATYPIQGAWRNSSMKSFLENYEAGNSETGSTEDEQIEMAASIVPLVAMYAGREDMLDVAEDAIRVIQNNDLPVTVGLATARLIEHYILYGTSSDAVSAVMAALKRTDRRNPQELDTAVVGMLGKVQQVKDNDHAEVVAQFGKG